MSQSGIQLDQTNHRDVIHFTGTMLAPIFGSPENGLAQFVRLTQNFRRWRERVEWCAICRAYAPIDPPATPDQTARHACRYAEHISKTPPSKCSGSRRSTAWCGADTIPNLTAKAVAIFASEIPNQRSPK